MFEKAVFVALLQLLPVLLAFSPIQIAPPGKTPFAECRLRRVTTPRHSRRHSVWQLKSVAPDKNEDCPETPLGGIYNVSSLGPATTRTTTNDEDARANTNEPTRISPPPPPPPQTVVMLTNEMKRILIEELGYRRKDVEIMRVELAAPAIEKRIQCPPEGMPKSWCDPSLISSQPKTLAERLENESKYPLKGPLLAASLILLGKGLSDAVITIIKVNSGFRGATLTEEFLGVPVLAIDLICVVVGAGFGAWTWTTMRDE